MAPTKHLAIVVKADGSVGLDTIDVPKPGPGEVLIKVVAAAQNPTDWKTAERAKVVGAVSGCDFSGVVEELGPDTPSGLRKVGERVASFLHGGAYPNGGYSEYVVASAQRVVPIPKDWSFEDAAQYGVAPLTAVQTLWESQKDLPKPLSPPSANPIPILVWGGASSVGNYVIQFAKLSGLRVLTTSSAKNFDLVKSLGADEVFDYRDPEVTKKIKEATKGQLKHAVDCVSEDGTVKQISDSLSEEGGTISVILGVQSPRPEVKAVVSLAYDLQGKSYEIPYKKTITPEQAESGLVMWKYANEFLSSGKLKPSPTLIFPKGLASVPEGFQYMKDGKVSGEKLTYRIADTPRE